jgi:hypothetical protein
VCKVALLLSLCFRLSVSFRVNSLLDYRSSGDSTTHDSARAESTFRGCRVASRASRLEPRTLKLSAGTPVAVPSGGELPSSRQGFTDVSRLVVTAAGLILVEVAAEPNCHRMLNHNPDTGWPPDVVTAWAAGSISLSTRRAKDKTAALRAKPGRHGLQGLSQGERLSGAEGALAS